MLTKQTNPPLYIGIALSLLVHVLVLVPLLIASFEGEGSFHFLEARFDPEDFENPEGLEPPEEPPTPLGIDADTPSSLTWVGYDTYQEHLAALAEVEQAAFTDDPVIAQPLEPVELPRDEVVESENEPTERAEEATNELAQARPLDAIESEVVKPENLAALRNAMDAFGQFLARLEATRQESSPSQEEDEEIPVEETPTPAQPIEEPKAAPPVTPLPPKEPTTGEQAKQDSDATAIIETNPRDWKPGKPLASPGLKIYTQRPEFTILQRITLYGKNPLCKIMFASDGRPLDVKFLEETGNPEFDKVMKATLHRWRAEGERLKELKKGETADVVIRITISR